MSWDHHIDGPIAVIGAGPGGLTTAKHLLEEGLRPVVFEASDAVGGQWHVGSPASAVWPGMSANASRTTMAFSDLTYPTGVAVFPQAEDVHRYLQAYAARFGVAERVCTGARVEHVRRHGRRWIVRVRRDDDVHEEEVGGVVVATGRYRRPSWPELPGLAELRAAGRARHSAAYRGRDAFRGRRVLVIGNSISGLEIAADLAADPTIAVHSAAREARLIAQKVVRGVPSDWRIFTRLSALLGAALPPETVVAGMRAAVLAETGDPARYGGLPVPAEGPVKLSQSQGYLPAVAEGRITVHPGVEDVTDGLARFADGRRVEVDEVLCATGYALELPFLAPDVRDVLGPDDTRLELHARTFHPDLPGLAFVGQQAVIGSAFPVLELQGRWIAAVWSGAVEAPSAERMRASIAQLRHRPPGMPDVLPELAALLAAELGVEPDPAAHPDLAEGLLFGPLAPARYRLEGHGARPDGEALLRAALGELGAPVAASAQQVGAVRMAAQLLDDPSLAAVADDLEGLPVAARA